MKLIYHHPIVYSDQFASYDIILKNFFDKVVSDGVEIEHTWSKRGTQAVQFESCDILNTLETVQVVLDAQERNFDGVIIGCSLDIGLTECREIAEIPVVCIMESAMLASCQMGKKFSLISFGEKARTRQEQLITKYGISERLASVRKFEMSLTELGSALSNPESDEDGDDETVTACTMKTGKRKLKEVFMEEAKKAVIEDKAEIIIPGCGILSALCMVDEISCVEGMEEVPVIDTFVPALKHLEGLILMKNTLGINCVSRAGLYQFPGKELVEQVKKL